MPESRNKEDLSISYISALAANAGIDYDTQPHDDDSTDGILKKEIILDNGSVYAELHVQLKSTSSQSQYVDEGETISYALKAKNYNDLCMPRTVPIILALLILPENKNDWTVWTPEELILKGRMYWINLVNRKPSQNSSTVTVKIPKSHRINIEQLNLLLQKVAKDEAL